MSNGPHSFDRLAAQEAARLAGAPPGDVLERQVCHEMARGSSAAQDEEGDVDMPEVVMLSEGEDEANRSKVQRSTRLCAGIDAFCVSREVRARLLTALQDTILEFVNL